MLFLLRLKDLWKGERDKYNSHHKYPYAAGSRQTGRQLFQLIYTHVCVCVRVCVAGWELAAAGRAKRVCKVTAVLSLCSRRQNGGRRQTSLTNVSYAYMAHLSHIPIPRSPHSMRPSSLLLVFYDTLLCACGRASYKNSCTFCLHASRMLLLPPV